MKKKKPRFPWALLLQSAFISEGIITITCDDDVTKDGHIKKETVLMGRFLSQTSINIKAGGRMYPSWIQPPNRPCTV